ncbi:helicase-related protein [Janibacter sp. FSL W8-0316]|uniref:helicase-related protein n=1 Tax=Janibacter sp. FSL W8-0316 TaxID=2975325 RepID=UPI0030FA27BC
MVLPESEDDFLVLRPLGGSDDDIAGVFTDEARTASFPPPRVDDLGDESSAALLRAALRIGFRSSAGPFRSLAGIAVEPRSYQLVPLLMALRQDVVRLLIADDVGIGKTVEAGLIAKELLELGEARGLTVLCSPALAEQWRDELREKFGLRAELVLPSTARRLERELIGSESVFEHFPVTVVSTDFIKSDRRRHEFLRTCPDLVIVDEAHTCVADDGTGGRARTQRYDLVKSLAVDASRHLLLVTATPHSGKDETFRNLIALLDPALAAVDLEQRSGREHLARHMVQRRRADIRKYLDESTPFPKDRQTQEVPYKLTSAYLDLFEQVLQYARETVTSSEGGLAQRVSWWSALALLRALASSPRAAAQTLATRSATAEAVSIEAADALGRAVVLDQADDEALEAADVAPGAGADDDTTRARRLRAFHKAAVALEGAADAKLTSVTKVVKQLLADGYQPIVFCRFIDTADYVYEHLSKAIRNTTFEVVTGTLPPAERSARIDELGRVEGPRVLVATDCLSEGVNLQDQFQAVVHYDLAWNPTRHEQREGRVDRFGQRHDVVRAVTMYGQDNKIDGIVLDVLLRKHQAIRKATGVSVPVPDNSQEVVEALMEGLLLRGLDAEQGELPLGLEEKKDALDAAWDSAADRESKAVTKYAQTSIHPEEVAAEVEAMRAALGSRAEVRDFVSEAMSQLGSSVTPSERGYAATTTSLPIGLRDALPRGAKEPLPFVEDYPVSRGEAVLHRTDDAVEAVARYVLESALDPQVPDHERPARRCGVVRTASIGTATTLLLVRYRFRVVVPGRDEQRASVAEQVATLAYTGPPSDPRWLSADDVEALLAAKATGNVPSQQAAHFMQRTLDGIDHLRPALADHGAQLAAELVDSHRRVRKAAQGASLRGLSVEGQGEPDVLGTYHFLPTVVS